MQLILHCGDSKTGSSSIQQTLNSNSDLLLNEKILYYSDDNNGHFNFGYLVGKRNRVSPSLDKEITEKVLRTLSKIKELVKKHEPDFLILSSEKFFSYNEQEIQTTIGLFEKEFSSIHSILYIRNPCDFYLSATQQILKANHKINNPILFKRNFLSPLQRWEKFVGKENFYCTIFHKNFLLDQDVVKDFFKKVETITNKRIPITSSAIANETISSEQMILIQEFRRDFLYEYENQFMPSSSNLIRFFLEVNKIKKIGGKPKLKPSIKEIVTLNNKDFILGVDKILGNQSFSNLVGTCDLKTNHIQNKNKLYTEVEEIISSYNKEIYCAFKNIIFEYSVDLVEHFKIFLIFYEPEDRMKIKKIYIEYLKFHQIKTKPQLELIEKI